MNRDYAAEASNNPRSAHLVEGSRLLCALDEQTCLICLEYDGKTPPGPLPLHEGCRCVTVPVLKTAAELGLRRKEVPAGTRSSSIGQVPNDGGLYKRYLLARARGVRMAFVGVSLARHLRQWLETEAVGVAAEPEVGAAVRAALLADDAAVPASEIIEILSALPWTSPNLAAVFAECSARGMYDEVEECLRRMSTLVPDGPNAGRHRASLHRIAADSMCDASSDHSRGHLQRAAELDPTNTSVHLKLAKLLREQRDFVGARSWVDRVLSVNPAHKGAQAELARISRSDV
jgi:tetratricopeptide (TPR) repeat protein